MANGNGQDFDVVAAGTVAQPEPGPTEVQQTAQDLAGEPVERWEIPPKWALGSVKAFFYVCFALPTQDPRWVPSDAEAEGARPQMQAGLQLVVDKWLPVMISKWAKENSPMLDLVGALGVVGYGRWQQIQKEGPLPDPNKKPAEVVQMPSRGAAPAAYAAPAAEAFEALPVEPGGEYACEVCLSVFTTRRELGTHECKGKPA